MVKPDIGVNQLIIGNTAGLIVMKVEVSSHYEGGVIGTSGNPLNVGQVQHGDMGGVRATIVGNDPNILMSTSLRGVSHQEVTRVG
eukprot:6040329-Amphidinium_carterae.1